MGAIYCYMFPSLYSILFEEVSPENRTNFLAAPFALFVNNKQLILYDISRFPAEDCVAAYIKIREDKEKCPSATQIAQAARADNYPGAGEIIYKIASTVYGKPITSDRYQSTSPSAQGMWNKITSNPSFKKTPLDNWIWNSDFETKTYVHSINKNKRIFQISDKPQTPSPEDDCVLPGDPVDKNSPLEGIETAISILGTPDSFETKVDISELIKNHTDALAQGKVDKNSLKKFADKLWSKQIT